MREKKKTIYYRFVEQLLNALRIAHVRRFPHKHDPKKYGVWAHACLLALKELENKPLFKLIVGTLRNPNIFILFETWFLKYSRKR